MNSEWWSAKKSSFRWPFLVIGILCSFSNWGQTKSRTIGELLSQAGKKSRGGGIGAVAGQGDKDKTLIPKSNYDFPSSATNENIENVKPPRSVQFFKSENHDQAEYQRLLDRQIDELYKLTKRFKDSRNRGELWLRLAELYVEKAAIINAHEQDEYDKKLHKFLEGKTTVKPVYEMKESKTFYQKAIQLYEWFQKDFPKDEKMDQALFFLGFNYFEMGNSDRGAFYYDRLVKGFPQSPFVGESEFALGEYYFEKDKWQEAYKHYYVVMKDKSHRLYTLAVYKGAWCLYRLTRYKEALRSLESIIRLGRYESANNSKKQVNKVRLEQEAQRDLVLFYSSAGDPEKALEYFTELVGGDVTAFLDKLAFHYSDKGNKEAARIVFKILISRNPTGSKSFEYQYQIVQNYFYIKNTEKFKEELFALMHNYGPNSSWFSANAENKKLIENSQKLRETTMRTYILQHHQSAQNSRSKFSQTLAYDGYQVYFKEFADSPSIADMHFYYGELLYDMSKYDEASIQYKWLIDQAPTSKFASKAAANLLHSVERSIPTDEEMAQRVGESVEKLPLEARVERFIKAGEWYLSRFPTGPKAQEIKFRTGRLYYQSNHFDEANQIFQSIVKEYPKTKYAEYSANLMLDIYNLKKDYVGLEKAGTELLAVPAIAQSKAGSDIRGVLEKASFKKAQELGEQKKYQESAQMFEIFYKQNPKSDMATTAVFNAGVNFEKAGSIGKAIAMYTIIMTSKNSNAVSYKSKTRKLLARLYQDSGQLEEAAQQFGIIADEDPKDKLLPNYLYNAAVLYEALGKENLASKYYERFRSVSHRYQDKLEALYSLAEIERKKGHAKLATEKYTEYIQAGAANSENVMQAYYWVATLLQKRGQSKEAEEWRHKTIYVQRRLSEKTPGLGAEYAAQFKLIECRKTYDEFRSIHLPQNPAKQKVAFERKVEFLSKLTNQLGGVIKYDSGPEIVTALTLLGRANLDLANSMASAPLPPGLTVAEKKQYQDMIQSKFVDPAKQKALDAFKRSVDKASELGVFTEDWDFSRGQLSKADPTTYYNNEEVVVDIKMNNWMGADL